MGIGENKERVIHDFGNAKDWRISGGYSKKDSSWCEGGEACTMKYTQYDYVEHGSVYASDEHIFSPSCSHSVLKVIYGEENDFHYYHHHQRLGSVLLPCSPPHMVTILWSS